MESHTLHFICSVVHISMVCRKSRSPEILLGKFFLPSTRCISASEDSILHVAPDVQCGGIAAAWTTKEDAHPRGRVAHPSHRAGCEEEIPLRALNTPLFHPNPQTFDFRRSTIFLHQTEMQSVVKSSSFEKSFSPTGRSGMSNFI